MYRFIDNHLLISLSILIIFLHCTSFPLQKMDYNNPCLEWVRNKMLFLALLSYKWPKLLVNSYGYLILLMELGVGISCPIEIWCSHQVRIANKNTIKCRNWLPFAQEKAPARIDCIKAWWNWRLVSCRLY